MVHYDWFILSLNSRLFFFQNDMEEIGSDKRQGQLRKEILRIQTDKTLSLQDKAFQMQQLMMPTQSPKIAKTVLHTHQHDGKYGCEHYERGALMKTECCDEFVTCRQCHDNAHSHQMDRFTVKEILCMYCDTIQPPSKECIACHTVLGTYYCDICHLWDSNSRLKYHCDDCGICRAGNRDDYYHCETCDTCLSLTMKGNHPCLEKTSHSDCPICNELLFSSTKPLTLMKCGHAIHVHCLNSYLANNYQCPCCLSSVADMTEFFNRMDVMIEEHKMPEEYKHMKAEILCNDCHLKEKMPYHLVGHKCTSCKSWNTRVIATFKEME